MKKLITSLFCLSLLTAALATEKSNILWIVVEDMSCHFGYQAETLVHTPNRPYLQPCEYKDSKPWMAKLRELDQQGQLNAAQKLVTAQTRPPEELYDLLVDPFEINNLAFDKAYAAKLEAFRVILSAWEKESGDHGIKLESEGSYDSSMAAYLAGFRKRKDTDKIQSIEANMAVMKQWATDRKSI